MPQLLSRMDDLNWLTPSIADILEQGPPPPGGDGSIREQVMWIQQRFIDLETPARIVNVRATPSYTLFIVRTEGGGRLGSRPAITSADIRRSLGKIAEERKEWRLGFIPQLVDMPEAMGVLLRTDEHQTMSLRRMMVRTTFRDHASSMAFIAGNTLEQRLIVDDLAALGSIVVVGPDAARQHFVLGTLLTLLALNTPSEIRLVITGATAQNYRILTGCPHALGRVLESPEAAQPLIDGLRKELGRRQEWFKQEDVASISAYNLILRDKGKTRLPRIVIVFDSVSDEGWKGKQEIWAEGLTDLAENGGKFGIHLIVSAAENADLPESLASRERNRIITRSAATEIVDKIESFHNSLMRFIDAIYIDSDNHPTPVEVPTIFPEEVKKTVEYWKQIVSKRAQDSQSTQISGKTGVTGMLSPPSELAPDDESEMMEAAHALPLAEPQADPRSPAEVLINQAQSLAAYLGWIGAGPLQDILGLSPDAATGIIAQLKKMGIVENTSSNTPRFLRPGIKPNSNP